MKTILVTAIGSFAADAVIKTYKREGHRVLGCDIYPAQWVVNSQDVEMFYKAPRASDRQAYAEFIRAVCAEQQVDYVVPLTDVEVDVLTGIPSDRFEARICISEPEAIALCRDKYRMEQYLKPLGICRTIPGQLLEETDIDKLEYPVVVKPVNGRSSQGLCMVEQKAQMRQVLEECMQDTDTYLVQPRLTGHVVTVDVVRDPMTGDVVCLPRRELLRTLNGAGTSVYVFRDETLEGQCRAIARAIGVQGCVNMEFMETEEPGGNAWYFLECNPRFSGGVAFSCMAGYDMAENHLRCFLGEPIQKTVDVKPQYIARRYQEYGMG